MVWMVLFHFSFDLNHLGWLQPPQNFYRDAFWTTQRSLIVSLFLLCAGLGQAVALRSGLAWPRFWRRWAQVAGCAVLVSAGSALMLLACRLAAPLGAWLWPLGALLLVLPRVLTHAFFDSRWTNWVGLVSHKPITEDYVPLLP